MNDNETNTPAAPVEESAVTTEPEKDLTDSEKKALREEGKRALLKELGVNDCKTAKEGLEAYRKSIEANKTDIEKEREARAAAEQSAAENSMKAKHYEDCLTAMKSGANPDTVDDLIIIATAKSAESGKPIADIIETLKGNTAYSGFFSTSPVSGTGHPIGGRRPQGYTPKESIGERLANAQKAAACADNPYFK